MNLLRNHRPQSDPRVLVCSIGESSREFVTVDASAYAGFLKVDVAFFDQIARLSAALNTEYSVVHILCKLSAAGEIHDSEDGVITGTQLIQECCRKKVALLWLAEGNQADSYINGFRVSGQSLNLVMTLDRRGDNFPLFLEKLFTIMLSSKTLPQAWASLVPQFRGQFQKSWPECIFYAGQPNWKILP